LEEEEEVHGLLNLKLSVIFRGAAAAADAVVLTRVRICLAGCAGLGLLIAGGRRY